jgi:SNF2 family DNA or RNA helicase
MVSSSSKMDINLIFRCLTGKTLSCNLNLLILGTPIHNSLQDLFSLLHFIRDESGGETAQTFKKKVVQGIRNGEPLAFIILQVIIDFFKLITNQKQTVLYSHMLRRTKTQVIKGKKLFNLPPCEVETIKIVCPIFGE